MLVRNRLLSKSTFEVNVDKIFQITSEYKLLKNYPLVMKKLIKLKLVSYDFLTKRAEDILEFDRSGKLELMHPKAPGILYHSYVGVDLNNESTIKLKKFLLNDYLVP